jgi:phage/plasmid primase-like uncharacterized protein
MHPQYDPNPNSPSSTGVAISNPTSSGHAARSTHPYSFDNSALQRQIEQVDLVALAGSYTTLQKQGSYRYVGNCPIHGDRGSGTPNFNLYLRPGQKGKYHCFACGKHGDALQLVLDVEHLDKRAAMQRIGIRLADGGKPAPTASKASKATAPAADREQSSEPLAAGNQAASIEPPATAPIQIQPAGQARSLDDIVSACSLFADGGRLEEFCQWRGLTQATVAMWRIGHANVKVKAGELWQEVGGWVIPVENKRGDLVSVRYRIDDADIERAGRKYHTAAGGKSALAWYRQGSDDKQQEPRALIICEGELDAMAAWQAGYSSVAVPGTAHVNLLATAADNGELAEYGRIYICFDADEAGRKATEAAAGMLHSLAVKVRQVQWADEAADVTSYLLDGGNLPALLLDSRPIREPKFVFPTLADFISEPLPEWLIPGEIYTQSIVLLYGASEQGKTFVAAGNTLSLAQRRYKAVYVSAEGGKSSMPKRLAALLDYHGLSAAELEGYLIPYPKPINLYSREEVDELLYSLQAQNIAPDMFTFDTLGMSMEGGEENSNSDIHIIMKNVRYLIESCGTASAMLIHHTGKNESLGARGAAALKNDTDTMIAVSKDSDEQVKLTYEKQRDDIKPTLYRYLKPHTFNYFDRGKQAWVSVSTLVAIPALYSAPAVGKLPTGQTLTILDALALAVFAGVGITISELEEVSKIPEGSLYRPLAALIDAGWASHASKRAPYIITPEGVAALAAARQQPPHNPAQQPGEYEPGADDSYNEPAGAAPAGEQWPAVRLPRYTNGGAGTPAQSSLHDAAVAARQRREQSDRSELDKLRWCYLTGATLHFAHVRLYLLSTNLTSTLHDNKRRFVPNFTTLHQPYINLTNLTYTPLYI